MNSKYFISIDFKVREKKNNMNSSTPIQQGDAWMHVIHSRHNNGMAINLVMISLIYLFLLAHEWIGILLPQKLILHVSKKLEQKPSPEKGIFLLCPGSVVPRQKKKLIQMKTKFAIQQ